MSKNFQLPTGWNKKKASSLFQIQGGFAFKSTDTTLNGVRWLKIANVGLGNVKWDEKSYLPERFLQLHESFCLNNGDIVVAMTRPLLGGVLKIAQLSADDSPCLLNQRVGRLLPKEGVSKDFLFHVLKARRLAYKIESDLLGTDPPNLSIKIFKNIKILLPPLPEQKAIADLLSTWDEAIEKTERLIEAKEKQFKWLLNDLIHRGRSNHIWKGYNLSDLCSPISRKNSEGNTNVLTSSAQNGLVSQLEYYNKSVSAEDVTGYSLLKKGEFAYNRSSAKGYPYGATKRLNRYEKGVLSTLYLCFALKPDAPCESDFLLHLFESGAVNRELRAVCQEGARSHGLLNITKSDFFGIKLFLPTQDQQKKIQSALNTAQLEINLMKQLADKHKKQKRGLMQKMLSGEWRVKPEIINQYKGVSL